MHRRVLFLIDKYLAGFISREEVVTKAQDSTSIQQKLLELEMADGGAGKGAGAQGKS